MDPQAAAHDVAVQMIDTSIVRVHQHGACIARNKRSKKPLAARDEFAGQGDSTIVRLRHPALIFVKWRDRYGRGPGLRKLKAWSGSTI
jgi:hypothetical protein